MDSRGGESDRMSPTSNKETDVHIVGINPQEFDATHVHTIDMWFSDRRAVWIVERLNAEGDHVGLAHLCASEDDAADCVAEWLRAHAETHLVSPRRETRTRTARRVSRRAA